MLTTIAFAGNCHDIVAALTRDSTAAVLRSGRSERRNEDINILYSDVLNSLLPYAFSLFLSFSLQI